MKRLIQTLCITTTIICLGHGVYGRDPEAYLRVNTEVVQGRYVETSDEAKYYFVEIYMPEQLDQKVYDDLGAGRVKLGAIADGNDELPYQVVVSPEDCVSGQPLKVCARTHFRIYLPRSIDTSKTYEVFFDRYLASSGKALRFRSIPVSSDYSTVLTAKDPFCQTSFAVLVKYADESASFPAGKVPLRFATPQDRQSYRRYINGRITRVHNWLSGVKNSELPQIEFRVRPLNTLVRPPLSLNATEGPPGTFTLPNGTLWTPTEADLPRMELTSIKPGGSATGAVSNHFVVSCILTTESLPTEDFNMKVAMSALNPPPELQASLVKTGVSGLSFVAAPGKPEDEKVGERSIEKDLDIAASFVSSVEDTEKKNTDPNNSDTITVRERKTRATFDLRLNPFGTRTRIGEPRIVGTPPNSRTTATYKAWIPLFIDSKVSTGKITKDTLSLNRVSFGTQLEYRYIDKNALYPQYFRFIGRFSNASDRDFKQAEYKGTFEFRPIFSALNHPLVSLQTSQSQVIFDEDNQNSPNTVISYNSGGYEFVPFIGGELGRTWARGNPAPAVQPSDTVKRLYGGLDIILTPFARTTLTVSDTFYYNFGQVTKRRANYFIGSADFLLGKFANSNRAAHSVFVSFEKGQQPPFNNSSVNVIKLGYRITGDRLFSLIGAR